MTSPSTAALGTPAAGTTTTRPPTGRRVVDAPTRLAHALLALSFAGAYLTGDSEHWRALHTTLGYVFGGALVFRLLYGLFGPPQARLSLLGRRVAGAVSAFTSAVRAAAAPSSWPAAWRSLRNPGGNLALVLSIVALLALGLPLVASGVATLQGWGGGLGEELFEELHEALGNAVLAVVLAHAALVLALSLLRRRNLARPMLTGRLAEPGPDRVRADRAGLAGVLLLAVLAFGAWRWQDAPNGLLPGGGSTVGEHARPDGGPARAGGHDRDGDDDD